MSAAVAAAFRESGIVVRENFGTIEAFEKTSGGIRMVFSKDTAGTTAQKLQSLLSRLGAGCRQRRTGLGEAGVETDPRGYVRVDSYLRTTAPHIFAAGDITGRTDAGPAGRT